MGFFDRFRKVDPKKDIKKAANAYKKMQTRNIDVYKGIGQSKDQNTQFFDAYTDVIDQYLAQNKGALEEDENINALKSAYLLAHPEKRALESQANTNQGTNDANSTSNTPDTSTGNLGEKSNTTPSTSQPSMDDKLKSHFAKTELFHQLGEKDQDSLGKGIDPAAMKGMQDISQWMLRNCVKSGYFRSDKTADEKINFVHSFAMKQPARIKLYAYYMIEKGKRKEEDPEKCSENITESQMNYVPNLEDFKKKMIATGFKFWKRFDGSSIYWNKLEEAFHVANGSKEEITPFGDMSTMDVSGGGGGGGQNAPSQASSDQSQAGTNQNQTNTNQNPVSTNQNQASTNQDQTGVNQNQPVSNNTGNPQDPLLDKDKLRQTKLTQFMSKGKELMILKEALKKAGSDEKAKKEEDIRKAAGELISILKELYAADHVVDDVSKRMKMDISNEAEDNKSTKAQGYIDDVASVVDKSSQAVSFAGDNKITTWGLDKATEAGKAKLEEVQLAGNIMSVVSSGISLVSLVVHVVDVVRHGAQMTTGAKVMAGMDILSSGMSLGQGVTSAAMGIAGASETAMNTVGGAMGIASGSINLIAGGVEMYYATKQKDLSKEAETSFDARRKAAKEGTDEFKDSAKAAKTAKLQQRMASVKQVSAGAKMITGSLEIIGGALAASGVAAGFGALFSGLAAAVNLGVYIYKLVKKKQIVYQTIDDYIDMDSIYADVVGTDTLKEEKADEVKRQIRIQAAAKLGFSSRENLFRAITVEYAKNIYRHVFNKKGSKSDPATKAEEADPDYIKILEALNLKPDYGTKKPKVNTIAYQLQNI